MIRYNLVYRGNGRGNASDSWNPARDRGPPGADRGVPGHAPMRPRRLTAEHCRCVKHSGRPGPDRHTVVQRGYGLALVVKPSGSKSFTQRLTVEGRRTDVGLGAFTFHNLTDVGTAMDEAARPLVLPSAPFRQSLPWRL